MPGIVGMISARPAEACQNLVDRMAECLKYETFYTSGSHSAPSVQTFVAWTALKHCSSIRQPLFTDTGDVVAVVAGDCFPADQHTRFGRQRQDQNDGTTAVGAWLVSLYEERGEHFCAGLNGLFSGLVIDRRKRRVILFNDRYGLQRIYYHERENEFFFASEAKALLRILPELRHLDEEGLTDFLEYGCTTGHNTLFRGINLLPPASAWAFTLGECKKATYFAPATWESQAKTTNEAFATELQHTLRQILPRYFEPQGLTGVSLTGGLDTRMIMACRPSVDGLISYTFAGPEDDTVDCRLAARVAAACGIPHQVIRITQSFFSDFAALSDRTVYATDGTLGISGTHEIHLNAQARGLAPIRLTGNFGSEILRGTTTFRRLGLPTDLLSADARRKLSRHDASLTERTVSSTVFKEIPSLLFGSLTAAQSQITTWTPYLDNDLVALAFRAPAEAIRSSSAAIRVINEHHSRLAHIPTDTGLVPASHLRSLSRFWHRATFKVDYYLRDGMPSWFAPFDRHLSPLIATVTHLTAHRYLDYRKWFSRQLKPFLQERLADATVRQNPRWNRAFIDRLLNDHIATQKNYVREINTVLTIQTIERLLLRQPTEPR